MQPARPLALPTLRPPVADTGIFSPAPFPPPSEIRRADGAPGREYWQQRVDYTIRATLDTASRRISGTEAIRYTNNSPDTLRFVWMQLDQNLFRPAARDRCCSPPRADSEAAGFKGGFELERVAQCGEAPVRASGPRRRDQE